MTIFGLSIETFYLYLFMTLGALLILYMLFGDIFDGLGDISPGSIVNPAVVLSFFTIFSASGYIFEKTTNLTSTAIILISIVIAIVLVSLIHFFILLPMSKAEQSMGFKMNDLIGKTGEVNITIPVDGLGEVILTHNSQVLGYPARTNNEQFIATKTEVTVVKIVEEVLIVEPKHIEK